MTSFPAVQQQAAGGGKKVPDPRGTSTGLVHSFAARSAGVGKEGSGILSAQACRGVRISVEKMVGVSGGGGGGSEG
jgi:hypothetical protein